MGIFHLISFSQSFSSFPSSLSSFANTDKRKFQLSKQSFFRFCDNFESFFHSLSCFDFVVNFTAAQQRSEIEKFSFLLCFFFSSRIFAFRENIFLMKNSKILRLLSCQFEFSSRKTAQKTGYDANWDVKSCASSERDFIETDQVEGSCGQQKIGQR